MFDSIETLIHQAELQGSIAEAVICAEIENSGKSREAILTLMGKQLDVMLRSVEQGIQGVQSKTGLTGGDALKLQTYLESNETLCGPTVVRAVAGAVATNEVNAAMGRICATPTAGSAGVAPGVLSALIERYHLTREQQINFLFVAGGFGLVVANNASIAGATGGCQAEIGSASAMASAATVEILGGSPREAEQAFAMTIKNMLGLICDPVAGLVEVPCVKRNALGAAQALVSADMALAGVRSAIPSDEVVATMYKVGKELPRKFRETGEGGLADSPTGRRFEAEIFGESNSKL
ncbi:L-serine ammonia-lyase, iron-sulfur-dependent, subunit alpha [Erysipelothrix sp. HDW6B]|uniref:L-serine ammonia-lyase, iron-sulfur-dependent, subunit alpha n=1 Tax=Erysipelothrix TaxID=1647 RepID=UPI00135C6207|nr:MULTISPECIES: L-serine ammonia-lyase, iron-sulfur-dependent, subunit alpha [Erysipelothrix]QIK86680.1 L-serine ammonia-lyase, iron-sulfur-dependent, subunit alpha [Erysipelothrix sp. HDW6B]